MNLEALLKSLEIQSVTGSLEVEIQRIDYDSRRVIAGSLFVAVKGHQRDGVHYVTEALSAGAVAVVSEHDLDLGPGVVHIQVDDARRVLAELSNTLHGDLSRQMKIIGITGTNGKTTTAYLVRDLLRDGGFLPGLIGTVAYEIGDRALPASHTTPEAPNSTRSFIK